MNQIFWPEVLGRELPNHNALPPRHQIRERRLSVAHTCSDLEPVPRAVNWTRVRRAACPVMERKSQRARLSFRLERERAPARVEQHIGAQLNG
jgi:hypothetical protein